MGSIAILPAAGIGDALLMMIAAHACKQAGYPVTVYHNHLPLLHSWFPGYEIRPLPDEKLLIEVLGAYSLIIAENDNSSKIKRLIQSHRSILSLFYPSYKPEKHAPIDDRDQCFDSTLTMVDNISIAVSKLLRLSTHSKENGIFPPDSLAHRSKPMQVVIHPTSSSPNKNWRASKFLQLALKLKQQGFSPVFVTSQEESPQWEFLLDQGLCLAKTVTLSDLASLIYESGYVIGNDSLIGHLASNLQIPTLIIADNPNRMQLWRPGWLIGRVVFPPSYLPKKIEKYYWQHFIRMKKVWREFFKLQQIL